MHFFRNISILLSVAFNLTSCHQKEYELLLLENQTLQTQIDTRYKELGEMHDSLVEVARQQISNSLEAGLYGSNRDSIFALWSNKMAYCAKKLATVNQQYSNEDALFIIKPVWYDTLVRTQLSLHSDLNLEKFVAEDKRFIFIPEDIGFYYWHGELNVINPRTGRVETYRLKDSIYIHN